MLVPPLPCPIEFIQTRKRVRWFLAFTDTEKMYIRWFLVIGGHVRHVEYLCHIFYNVGKNEFCGLLRLVLR